MEGSARPYRRRPALITLVLTIISLLLPVSRAPMTSAAAAGEPSTAPGSAARTAARAAEGEHRLYLPLLRGEPPTSAQLIDAAVAEGRLDTDQGLLYKIYATFDDELLPAAFRGSASGIASGTALMAETAARYPAAAPAVQEALAPFFVPPFHEGSWHDRRLRRAAPAQVESPALAGAPPGGPLSQQWLFVDGEHEQVRVWWQKRYDATDAILAAAIREALDMKIAPQLELLMGREPIDDGGESSYLNGGGSRLDIALVDFDAKHTNKLGLTIQHGANNGCRSPAPSYIQINRATSGQELLATTAHEYMHTILRAYKLPSGCIAPEYRWLDEATATWAEDYVYPAIDTEHEYAPDFLDVPETPLESFAEGDLHPYGAYLFLLYLARTYNPRWIPPIWEQAEQQSDSLAAINAALRHNSGGRELDFFWPLFARTNLNQHPPYDLYRQDDRLATVAKQQPLQISLLVGVSEIELDFPAAGLPHLGARYYPVAIGDEAIRSLDFYNGLNFNLRAVEVTNRGLGGTTLGWKEERRQGAHIGALIKVKGANWVYQDWTKTPHVRFCRDRAAENIESLVIVVSNSEWQDRGYTLPAPVGHLNSTLRLSNISCGAWEGTVTQTSYAKDSSGAEAVWKTVTTLRVTPLRSYNLDTVNGYSYVRGMIYGLVSGEAAWSYTGRSRGCQVEGSAQRTLPPGMTGALFIYDTMRSGPAHRGFHGSIYEAWPVTYQETCPVFSRSVSDNAGHIYTLPADGSPGGWRGWLTLGNTPGAIDSVVEHMPKGVDFGTYKFRWEVHLRAVRGP